MTRDRDVAVVLSGGGINAILLELGFLHALRESPVWGRIGWIYGTSAGALAGMMASLDRLAELESFVLGLQPVDTFRPNRLWQQPLTGLNDYVLPETIAERIEPIEELVAPLAESPIELLVCVTDVGDDRGGDSVFDRTFSSRTTPPDLMGAAVLASAAISALVLPVRVGDMIATDGGWVRNFPLGHAYDNPDVGEIIGFRTITRYPRTTGQNLERLRHRLERFRAVPPIRALIAELHAAEARQARGEPPHLPDMLLRLMRVAVARNTESEIRSARATDRSIRELDRLRLDLVQLARRNAVPWRRNAAAAAVEERFRRARFPFRHDRLLPTTIIEADPGERALDSSFRSGVLWPLEEKRGLIELGQELGRENLRGVSPDPREKPQGGPAEAGPPRADG